MKAVPVEYIEKLKQRVSTLERIYRTEHVVLLLEKIIERGAKEFLQEDPLNINEII